MAIPFLCFREMILSGMRKASTSAKAEMEARLEQFIPVPDEACVVNEKARRACCVPRSMGFLFRYMLYSVPLPEAFQPPRHVQIRLARSPGKGRRRDSQSCPSPAGAFRSLTCINPGKISGFQRNRRFLTIYQFAYRRWISFFSPHCCSGIMRDFIRKPDLIF